MDFLKLINKYILSDKDMGKGLFAWSGLGAAPLKNTYFAMRHGTSEANEKGTSSQLLATIRFEMGFSV